MASFGLGRPRPLVSAARQFFLTFRDLHHTSRAPGCRRHELTKYAVNSRPGYGRTSYQGCRALRAPTSRRAYPSQHDTVARLYHDQTRFFATSASRSQQPKEKEGESPSSAPSRNQYPSDHTSTVTSDTTAQATRRLADKNAAQDVKQDVVPPKPLGPVLGAADTVLAALSGENRVSRSSNKRKHSTPQPKDQLTSDFYTQQAVSRDAMRQQTLFEDAEQTTQEALSTSTEQRHQIDIKENSSKAFITDKVVQIMRRVPQPLAIITTLSSTRMLSGVSIPASDIKGMTLSSVDSVTIDPTPFISFNSKIPSTTFSAIVDNPNSEFTVHILRGNSKGAQVAHAFATGSYTEDMSSILRIQADRTLQHTLHMASNVHANVQESASLERVLEDSDDDFPTSTFPNNRELSSIPPKLLEAESIVFATLHCRLHGEKCVQVGDHVLAVAEVTHAMKHRRLRGSSGTSLYYYNKEYYGQSQSVKPLAARPQDVQGNPSKVATDSSNADKPPLPQDASSEGFR